MEEGRFAGYGNLAFALVASAAILLAALVAHRVGGRRGAWTAIGLLFITLVLVGMPMWGSDVGGVLTLVPTIGVMAMLLLGWKVGPRAVVGWGLAALATVGVFGVLDLARPPEQRTHLGRLFERVGDDGWDAFETVVLRKLMGNLSVFSQSVWILMVPLVFVFLAVVVWRAPGRLREIRLEIPELRAALVGLMIAGALGFALNDSGIAVPGLMLGVINGSLVFLVVRAPVRTTQLPATTRAPKAEEIPPDPAEVARPT